VKVDTLVQDADYSLTRLTVSAAHPHDLTVFSRGVGIGHAMMSPSKGLWWEGRVWISASRIVDPHDDSAMIQVNVIHEAEGWHYTERREDWGVASGRGVVAETPRVFTVPKITKLDSFLSIVAKDGIYPETSWLEAARFGGEELTVKATEMFANVDRRK
jgi:hypothetical protein